MPTEIVLILLIIFLTCYLLTICTLNRENSLYLFIIVWLVFPNHGDNVIGIAGVPMFTFIEFGGASALAIKASSQTTSTVRIPSAERVLIGLILAAAVLQHVLFFLVPAQFLQPQPVPATGDYIEGFLPEISAALFFYACFRCVRNKGQIDSVLNILVIFSVVLFSEFLAVKTIPFIRNYLYQYSFNYLGRFDSLFLTDYSMVAVVCSAASISSMYFYASTRKLRYIPAFFTSTFLVLINAQRGIILALVIAAAVYFIYGVFARRGPALAFLAVLSFSAVYLLAPAAQFLSSAGDSSFVARKITQYERYDSLLDRVGIQQRAFEIIGRVFPFGVGNGMLRFYFNSEVPRSFSSENKHVTAGYDRVARGIRPTQSHNGYVETVASYGLIGVVAMLYFIFIIIRNFSRTKIPKISSNADHKTFICINSILIFCAIYFLFQAYPKVYVLYFFAARASCLFFERYRSSNSGRARAESSGPVAQRRVAVPSDV